ncbi:YHS domain-containing protein [Microvenator marinus]|nr:YHS domain-containing protein [Microvenator marinus]
MKNALLVIFVLGSLSCGSKQAVEPDGAVEPETTTQKMNEEAPEPMTGPATATSDVLPNDGTRKVGDVTTCPVTHDVFTISATSPSSTHEGKTYYFCCKGCVKDFDANPAEFLSGAKSAAAAPEHDHHDHAH